MLDIERLRKLLERYDEGEFSEVLRFTIPWLRAVAEAPRMTAVPAPSFY